MNKATYFQVTAVFPSPEKAFLESLSEYAMTNFHCEGVEEFSLEEARVDEILGERAYSGGDIPDSILDEVETTILVQDQVAFKFFFYSGKARENAQSFKSWLDDKTNMVTVEEFSGEDWNQTWRSHYKTLNISPNLRVVPEWKKDSEEKQEGDIYIYPGQGFGTGEHETTFLCLQLFDKIQKNLSQSSLCFDFGCGSGILGIAAIAHQDMQVDFCDIDREALNNCLQNLNLNFEKDQLNGHSLISRERFVLEKEYDLVFANILENVLISEKELILKSIKRKGFLIVSGLLNDQVENIKEEYKDLSLIETASKNDWSALLFIREQ